MTPATVAAPVCSEEVESWLRARGARFKPCQQIKLDDIDVKASRANQARADALDAETVDRYVQAMTRGDEFPPIVVYRTGKRYVIVDGNHRDEASRKTRATTISAYELDPGVPAEIIELLTVEANTRHGLPTRGDWRQRQAVYLMSLGSLSIEMVAAATGLTESGVQRAQRIDRVRSRGAKLGIRGFDNLNITVVEQLGRVASDPVFAAAANLVIETEWGAGQSFREFVATVRAQGSDESAMNAVGIWAEQRSAELQRRKAVGTRRAAQIKNPKMRYLSAFGAVLTLDPTEARRVFLNGGEREEAARRAGDAALVLMQIEEALSNG